MKNPQHVDMQPRRKLIPHATITLGQVERAILIQQVWPQATPMARALLVHKDFVVAPEPQVIQLVALGWDIFKESVPLEDIGTGKLLDRDYLFEWSKAHLNSQQILPCEAEDAVQLWAQHLRLLPDDEDDMFGERRPWSSMQPLPNPYGMRFFLGLNVPDSNLNRCLAANQYGVGNVCMSNIFHNHFGRILYRLVDVQ